MKVVHKNLLFLKFSSLRESLIWKRNLQLITPSTHPTILDMKILFRKFQKESLSSPIQIICPFWLYILYLQSLGSRSRSKSFFRASAKEEKEKHLWSSWTIVAEFTLYPELASLQNSSSSQIPAIFPKVFQKSDGNEILCDNLTKFCIKFVSNFHFQLW